MVKKGGKDFNRQDAKTQSVLWFFASLRLSVGQCCIRKRLRCKQIRVLKSRRGNLPQGPPPTSPKTAPAILGEAQEGTFRQHW